MKNIFFLFTLLLFVSCELSDDEFETGKSRLEEMGYTNIEKSFENDCCDVKDQPGQSFKAISPKGNQVNGSFCRSGNGVIIVWN